MHIDDPDKPVKKEDEQQTLMDLDSVFNEPTVKSKKPVKPEESIEDLLKRQKKEKSLLNRLGLGNLLNKKR